MACSPNVTVYTGQRPFAASTSSTTDTVTISVGDVDAIVDAFNSLLKPHGFQVHPFLVGWYNELCSPRLQLSGCPSDQLALCIISTPDMFERNFLPHIFESLSSAPNLTAAYEQFDWPKQFSPQDPLDRSVYLRITHTARVFFRPPRWTSPLAGRYRTDKRMLLVARLCSSTCNKDATGICQRCGSRFRCCLLSQSS
uniref:Cyanocobalamin reductase (cyanide-eliminating) n=1 Tax=Schistocephalus solidus TaxID=70667 RepID=A0A0X3PK79_SCHSO